MACVALTCLIKTIEIEFVQPTPRVRLSPHDSPLIIISILENLSCLQAFLQKKNKSSGDGDGDGDGDALRDLEIEIRDFALKVEDDIELQISNIILLSEEYPEKASHEELLLHQILQEAAKYTTQLMERCVSEREMAIIALTSLIKKLKHYFLPHFQMVYGGDEATTVPFLEKLSSLQRCLLAGNNSNDSGAALKKLETKIRIFALKAQHDLQIQLTKEELKELPCIILSTMKKELRQTLLKAAEIAVELFHIINKEKEHERERDMACNALTSLRKTIIDQMEYDYKLPMAVSLHESNLMKKLSSLQLFLHKESSISVGGGGAAIKDLETKIHHFALKAKRDINKLKYNYTYNSLHRTIQEAAKSAEELLNIINCSSSSSRRRRRRRRSNEEVDDYDDGANQTQPLKHADGSASSYAFLKPKGRMVGRHHDCTVIKDQLFSFAYELKIISIVGMVGIGKTTLARKLYENPSIASHFDVRGWVTIPPQHYNKSQMLSELLQSITTPKERNAIEKESTSDELQMQVRECLRGKKYLIVVDNIMSNQAWTDIKDCVPNDKIQGKCILLTTRHFNQYYHGSYYIHSMTLLDPKESWKLFCNILSIDEEHLAPEFEKIRHHVMEKCDGLPQLIVEVAKRLSKCNNIQEKWKKIEKELESLGILNHNALTVSYNPLPHHLKVCFLYFGVFPKREKILVKMLVRLWIAEGFVKPLEHDKELEDQAYEYLQELINRSLLLIVNTTIDGKIKTCRMHSAMHTFCVGEAQKEGILCAINTQQHVELSLKEFANSSRWLSLYSHSFDYYVLFGANIPRSIFFFHENPEMFVPPKLLRVLAFDTSLSLQSVPMQLRGLVFLRYLYIKQWFEDMNDVVSNNPNLETLVVSGNGPPTVHLPSSIWKPPHLRHVELGNSYMVDPPSADKENLQTLSWVDDIETPSHIEGCCSSNPIILDHFDYFKWLEKLSISVSIGCNAALPELARFPLGLKKLKLSGTNISEGDLNVIGMLPHLMVLKLENAFHGTAWEVEKGRFPELIFLLLEAKELKRWVVTWSHFRILRHLVLRSCSCLEQMPKDLSSYKLETIELEGCNSSLVASAKQFQQKRRSKDLKIKILDPEYDESEITHIEVPE